MAFLITPYASAALTVNGTANGILTVADSSLFRDRATVYLVSSAAARVELIVEALLSATTLAVKGTAGYQYSRYDCSAYLVANTATLIQPEQPDFSGADTSSGSWTSEPSVPTTGTWALGDIVLNSTPVAGGVWGWICIAAGTPGTWKSLGAVSV
jgi:hypothetical protein